MSTHQVTVMDNQTGRIVRAVVVEYDRVDMTVESMRLMYNPNIYSVFPAELGREAGGNHEKK